MLRFRVNRQKALSLGGLVAVLGVCIAALLGMPQSAKPPAGARAASEPGLPASEAAVTPLRPRPEAAAAANGEPAMRSGAVGSGVFGRVRPAVGEAVVCAEPAPSAGGVRGPGTPSCDFTDAEGRYELSLPAGTFQVIASSGGLSADPLTVSVHVGARERADFELSPSRAQLQGQVVNRAGEPVVGAWISVQTALGGRGAAVTEAGGVFEVGAPRGPVQITVRAPGYGTESVIASSPSDVGRIELGSGGSIEGRVVRADSALPVAGAQVSIAHVGQPDGIWTTVTADRDGAFAFEDLPADRYGLVADSAEATSASVTPALLTEGANVLDVLVEVSVGSAVTGVVRSREDGTPCPEASATLYGERQFDARREGSSLRFDRVPPGVYQVSVLCPGHRAETAHESIQVDEQHAAFVWWVESALEVQGSVRSSSGLPLGGASVEVAQLAGPGDVETITVDTDAAGHYAARELGVGRYRVTARLADSTVAVSEARELELSQEHRSERVDFVAAAGARVTATCRSDSGGVADDLDLFGEAIGTSRFVRARPDGEGRFVFSDVPDGSYRFFANDRRSTPIPLRGPAGEAEVDLQAGDNITLTCVIERGQHQLSGRVVDDRGKPVRGASVSVEPIVDSPGAEPFDIMAVGGAVTTRVATSEDGRFTFDGLRDTRYQLQVQHLGRSVVRPGRVDVMTDIVLPRAARLALDLSFDAVGSGQARARVTNTRTEEQSERVFEIKNTYLTIEDLSPGEIRLEVSAGPFTSAESLDLAPGETRELALRIGKTL
jgi:carboxypeptidase family protein